MKKTTLLIFSLFALALTTASVSFAAAKTGTGDVGGGGNDGPKKDKRDADVRNDAPGAPKDPVVITYPRFHDSSRD